LTLVDDVNPMDADDLLKKLGDVLVRAPAERGASGLRAVAA
jgi:hypothetical protein